MTQSLPPKYIAAPMTGLPGSGDAVTSEAFKFRARFRFMGKMAMRIASTP